MGYSNRRWVRKPERNRVEGTSQSILGGAERSRLPIEGLESKGKATPGNNLEGETLKRASYKDGPLGEGAT